MQLINQIWVQALLAAAVFPLVYNVFATLDDTLSKAAKRRVADMVRSIDAKPHPAGASVRDVYEYVFSSRHFSLRCAGAVLAVSAICYLLTVLAIPGMREVLFTQPVFYLTEVMSLSLVINFIADFIALGATRLFVERIGTASGPKKLAMFFLDAGIKFVLVWVVAYLSLFAIGLIEGWQMGPPGEFVREILETEPETFVSIFTPLFLSSLWIWIYAGYLYFQPRLVSGMTRLLDFEDHAVRSLGLVTAATFSVLTFFVLVASALAGGA
jgi:hypothetical protein